MTDVVAPSPVAGGPDLPQERRLATEIPGPRARALHQRRVSAVAAAVPSALPIEVVAAGGGVIVDSDGNSLIDLGSGVVGVNVGNAAPPVAAAVGRQVAAFTHTCFTVTPYAGYVEVCEQLNRLTPGDHDKRSVLFDTEAEAMAGAAAIARHATGRPTIVAVDHGGELATDAAIDAAIDRVRTELGTDQVAAIVVEPIPGEAGFIAPGEGDLARLHEFCVAHGILLVADERRSGFGRTGRWFACEHEDLVADLVVTGSAIADGLPLAGVTGRAEAMDAVPVGGLGGSGAANPVTCAAALATIDMIEASDLVKAAERLGAAMRTRLDAVAAKDPGIREVRGRGLLQEIELVLAGTTQPDPGRVQAELGCCYAEGVVATSAGADGNVIRFLPPLVIGEFLLHEGLDVVAGALAATR